MSWQRSESSTERALSWSVVKGVCCIQSIMQLDDDDDVAYEHQKILSQIPSARPILPPQDLAARSFRAILMLSLPARAKLPSPIEPLSDISPITKAVQPSLQMQVLHSYKYSAMVRTVGANMHGVGLEWIKSKRLYPPQGWQVEGKQVGGLVFSSGFECGNLYAVSFLPSSHYQLCIRNDFNSKRFRQWFYFNVKALSNHTATFQITNFTKKSSLFAGGMNVAVHSTKHRQWRRACSKLAYTKNPAEGYSLYFSYTFEIGQEVYFAYSLPYSFTDLTLFLTDIQQRYHLTNFCKRLCTTSMGNPVDLLCFESGGKKPDLLLYGRAHPGQTMSNFIIEGFIRSLFESQQGKVLRELFNVWIVPMLNVDGVILGNYRSSLAGVDLNRRWASPNRMKVFSLIRQHPEVYFLKRFIEKRVTSLAYVIDIHAHSKQKGIFSYAYKHSSSPLFPLLLSKLIPSFDLHKCKLDTGKDKQGSARVVLSQQCKVHNFFTLECSFCGGLDQAHYSPDCLRSIGFKVATALQIIGKRQSESELSETEQELMIWAQSSGHAFQLGDGESSDSEGDLPDSAFEEQFLMLPKKSMQKKLELTTRIKKLNESLKVNKSTSSGSQKKLIPYIKQQRVLTSRILFHPKTDYCHWEFNMPLQDKEAEDRRDEKKSEIRRITLQSERGIGTMTCIQDGLKKSLLPAFKPILKKKSKARFLKL